MNKKFLRRTMALCSATAFFIASLSGYAPEKAAAAERPDTPLITTSTDSLVSPSAGEDGWSGDYIYFGEENGTPVKWRVLDKTGNGGNSSVAGGLLLQADKPVGEKKAYADAVQWLSDADGFLANLTSKEQHAVMTATSTKKVDSPTSLLTAAGVSGQKVFLPDAGDLATAAYGYRCSNGVSNANMESTTLWWLRSGYVTPGKGAQGCVLPGGMLFYSFDDAEGQIVPMLNVEKGKILFLSDASFNKSGALSKVSSSGHTDWKLTLLDDSVSVSTEDGDDDETQAARSGNEITVPYSVTDDSGSANQLSLMITRGSYETGSVLYYGKAADISSEKEGEITFTLPDSYDEASNSVYLVAEHISGSRKTDYAGEPVEITIPPLHVHEWASAWSYDDEAHWHECISELPGCDLEDDADKDGYEEHESGDDDEGRVIQAATCEEDGIIQYTCIHCGQPYEDVLDALGHEIDNWVVIKEATFLEEGLQRGTCTVCGAIEEEEIPAGIESHEHEYQLTSKKDASCEESGSLTYTCTEPLCGDSYTETVPALGHKWDGWKTIVAATETKTGSRQRTCTRCRKVETETLPVLPHTHKYNKDRWEISASSHWHICSCGAKSDVSAHNWDSGKVIKKPTKKQEGQITYTCRQCKYSTTCPLPLVNTKIASGKYVYQFTGIKNGIPTAKLLGFLSGKTAKTLNIPETVKIKGGAFLTVTKIRPRAFISRRDITKIIVPDTVEEIGYMAFFRASNVKNITLGKGVKKIGNHAFCHMIKLKSFRIKTTYLKKTDEVNYFHGMDTFQIYVPKKKKKTYQKIYKEFDKKVTVLKS